MLSDAQAWSWAAGLLEGEGCFTTRTNGNAPLLQCTSTDLDILQRLQGVVGGRIHEVKRNKPDHWKPAHILQLSGEPAAAVLRRLYPMMGNRRQDSIDDALTIWEKKNANIASRKHNGAAAAAYYRAMSKPSLRVAAQLYGVSYETVRRALNA